MRSPQNGYRAALMVANADGSGERTLVPEDEDNLQPAFVAHSKQILFLRSGAFEHHSPLVDNRRHKFDLFAADTVSGRVTRLTNKQFYEISHLSVSSDGKQVMLTASTYPEGDRFLIAPINDAESPTQVLQPKVPAAKEPVLYNAVWLPDNRSIVFMAATTPPSGGSFDYNVYRLTIETGAIERLTQLTGMLEGFTISADGRKAVLLRQGTFLILDVTTHQLTPVTR